MTTDKNKEQFEDVPNYIGRYQVSNLGRVKSLKRTKWNGYGWQTLPERILKAGMNKNGYYAVSLHNGENVKSYYVHQLVCMCFHSHTPDGFNGLVVDHINNIKTDNRAENLQLVTNQENNLKKFRDKKANELLNEKLK